MLRARLDSADERGRLPQRAAVQGASRLHPVVVSPRDLPVVGVDLVIGLPSDDRPSVARRNDRACLGAGGWHFQECSAHRVGLRSRSYRLRAPTGWPNCRDPSRFGRRTQPISVGGNECGRRTPSRHSLVADRSPAVRSMRMRPRVGGARAAPWAAVAADKRVLRGPEPRYAGFGSVERGRRRCELGRSFRRPR